MPKKILVTSALLYANGPLHFGHIAGAYLPGDCYSRFQRLMQNDVLYISGSDEYGVAITMSAEIAGRTPREHVDLFHKLNKELFEKLNFSFDHYSRTTWEGHKAPVHQYFQDLLESGYIEEKVTNQLFSEEDQKFLADRYVVGTCPACGFEKARGDECPKCGASHEATDLKNPRSKLTNAQLTLKPTKHWFLLLDKFKEPLIEWIEKKSWKPNVVNFVKGYIEGLRPRAITRDSKWGIDIPLPGTDGKVLYVWFDAPIGYISASMEWAAQKGTPDAWKEYWCDPETKLVHFIGKDNIPFHAAIFPAMTMGQKQPFKLVDELPANEFFNLEGHKFSKSEGWYVDLEDFLTRYSADQLRYTIAANAPETSDSEFTWKDFQNRCNAELLGKYGNLVNRTLVFAKNKCGGIVPKMGELQPVDQEFLQGIKRLAGEIADAYEQFKLRRACHLIMELAQHGNAYFEKKAPWKGDQMETTIACCLECLKALALTASPIIPEACARVWKMLGQTVPLHDWKGSLEKPLIEGQKLEEPKILFPKIEEEQIEQELSKLKTSDSKEPVTIDAVKKLDLRVGEIKAAEPVPKSKKLLKLEVDIGVERRTIVSGISQRYKPEELIGKKVVVVANLKPAKLMGVQSQGMILAGGDDKDLELVSVEGLNPGSVVQ